MKCWEPVSTKKILLFIVATKFLMLSANKLEDVAISTESETLVVWLNLRFRTFNVVDKAGNK